MMNKIQLWRVVKAVGPALVWLGVITFFSTRGTVPMPKFNLLQVDKLGHAGCYGLLVWLMLWGYRRLQDDVRKTDFRTGLRAFVLATGYGVLMEFVQYAFFPGRFYELDDMLANAIGAGIGWLLFSRQITKPKPSL